MLTRIHIIFSSEKEEDYLHLNKALLDICPTFSISTYREYPGMSNSSDFYITCDLKEEEIQPLLNQLNNDWDGEDGSYEAYGFNTKMFDSLVYYISFDVLA